MINEAVGIYYGVQQQHDSRWLTKIQDCCGSSVPLCSSLISLFVLPSGQTKQIRNGCVCQRRGPPLTLIPPLQYLGWATKDEQEVTHTLTYTHSTFIMFVAVYGCQS